MDERAQRVRAYVRSLQSKGVLPWASGAFGIEPMPGGERHQLFKVRWQEHPPGTHRAVVVRLNVIARDKERRKSHREARVLVFLEGRRSAPRLYDLDDSRHYFPEPAMCLAYIEGHCRNLSALPLPHITALGRTIGQLHRLDTSPLDKDGDAPTDLGQYLIHHVEAGINARVPTGDMVLPEGLSERCWQAHRRVCMAMLHGFNDHLFDADEPLSLLHGDLISPNIVWHANTPTLIDWEDTRVGDPAEEVAYFFTETQCDTQRRQAFWHGYSSQYRDEFPLRTTDVVQKLRCRHPGRPGRWQRGAHCW